MGAGLRPYSARLPLPSFLRQPTRSSSRTLSGEYVVARAEKSLLTKIRLAAIVITTNATNEMRNAFILRFLALVYFRLAQIVHP